MPLLDLKNLSISRGEGERNRIIDNVSLTIDQGDIRALIGVSGAGMSLIMTAIVGIRRRGLTYSAERYRIDGTDVQKLSPARRRRFIGRKIFIIFQDPRMNLDPAMTIRRQFREILSLRNFHDRWYRYPGWKSRRMENLPIRVGISNYRKVLRSKPGELTDIECRKINIALALAYEPELLIADEPLSAMSVSSESQILSLLDSVNKNEHLTMLIGTNDLAPIAKLAGSVSLLYAGQIVETGKTQAVLSSPKHPYTRRLIRSMNEMGGELDHDEMFSELGGIFPSWPELPIGCRFGPRCPMAERVCIRTPPAVKLPQGHVWKCHFSAPSDSE